MHGSVAKIQWNDLKNLEELELIIINNTSLQGDSKHTIPFENNKSIIEIGS